MQLGNIKEKIPIKITSKKAGIIIVMIAVLIALLIGIGIYNSPEHRLTRQLEVANKYLEEENYEQAVIEFAEAIGIDPMNVDARIGLAESYDALGEYDKAIEAYAEVLVLEPGAEEILGALEMLYLDYVQPYLDAEDYDKAISILEEGYELTGGESLRIKKEELEVFLAEKAAEELRLQQEEERKKKLVEIDPALFDIQIMGFDMRENHANEIWNAMLPFAKSDVVGESGFYSFYMENDVEATYLEYINREIKSGWSAGTHIQIDQCSSNTKNIYGKIEYAANPEAVYLHLWAWNGWQGAPMAFEKFINCPIARTFEECVSQINIDQIKEKGQFEEMSPAYAKDGYLVRNAWRFQTELGEGYYFECSRNADLNAYRYHCGLAINYSDTDLDNIVYSITLSVSADGGIGGISICVGKDYSWNGYLGMPMGYRDDVFHILE